MVETRVLCHARERTPDGRHWRSYGAPRNHTVDLTCKTPDVIMRNFMEINTLSSHTSSRRAGQPVLSPSDSWLARSRGVVNAQLDLKYARIMVVISLYLFLYKLLPLVP